jgi:hypothetical protein
MKRIVLKPHFRLFLHCALMVILLFADVVFKDASISMADQANFTATPRSITTLYRERDGLEPAHGFFDFGGSAFQSEPAIQFMKDAIYHGKSPYWNPYSGAGSFGPETMVDIKFSPLTLVIALFGGSSLVFHFFMLLAYTLAIYFLARTLLEYFDCSYRITMTTCFVYLLNGYFTANISSNTNQTYLYFPFAVFAVLSLSKSPSVRTFLIAILAYILPLLVTFFPTTVLMLVCVGALAMASVLEQGRTPRDRVRLMVIQMMTPVLALALLSFLYLPLMEGLRYVSAVELYEKRQFFPANIKSIISLFSAKHVFELHNAMHPSFNDIAGTEIFHFGILSGAVVATLLFSRKWLRNPLILTFSLLFLISLGRIFAVPGITDFIDQLPFFRSIASQYWWMMVACPFPFLFAFAVKDIEQNRFKLWPVVLVAVVILVDLIYILETHGIVHPPPLSPYISSLDTVKNIISLLLIVFLNCALFAAIKFRPASRSFLVGLLCVSVFFEMNFYFYRARYTRLDAFAHPPDYISFLKENLGLHRVAAYGSTGLPPEIGSAYQLQQIEFFTMNIFPSYYSLCQRDLTSEHGWWGKETFCANRDTTNAPNINLATLDFLSVRFAVVSKGMPQFVKFFDDSHFPRAFESNAFVIFENPNVFPRVYAVNEILEAPQTPSTRNLNARTVAFTEDLKLLSDARSQGVAVFNAATDNAPPSSEPRANPLFEAPQIKNYENNNLTIEAKFIEPGILVLPDNWHPNWKATDNGRPVYIGKVNQSFRGIALGKGAHFIEMKYEPSTLAWALRISLFVILALLGLFLNRRKIDPLLVTTGEKSFR